MSKERLTLGLCVSATGEILKPIIIGKYANPRCFKNPAFNASNFCHFYNNTSAWMTKIIFIKWLTDLNKTMIFNNRRILLLVDNFSGHVVENEFSNINLQFLPPNTTSVMQPCDQGIIKNFKLHYRHLLVKRYIHNIENYDEPFIPDVKQAILLTVQAIKKIHKSTIVNCWFKSDIIECKEETVSMCMDTAKNKLKEDIKGFFDKFKFDSCEEKVKHIQSFINDETSEENFLEELTDLQIVNTVKLNDKAQAEDPEECPQLVLPSPKEIKASIQQIKHFCLHQSNIQQNQLEIIDEVENILMNFINMNLKQKQIDDFFIKN